jgi:hypothetical protein
MGDVKVGERTITVGRFSLEKMLLIAGVFDTIMQRIPDLAERVETHAREYRARNTITISRAAAEVRHIRQQEATNAARVELGQEPLPVKPLSEFITEEAWEASGGQLELPASPGALEVAGEFFPEVYKVAQDEVLKMLALVAITSSELEEASKDGEDLGEHLKRIERELRRAPADEIFDLLGAAAEVLEDQFSGKKGGLAKLQALGRRLFGSESEPTTTDESAANGTTPDGSDEPEPERSTDSPPSTAGAESALSTASPGSS